jgi:hypothetical protein
MIKGKLKFYFSLIMSIKYYIMIFLKFAKMNQPLPMMSIQMTNNTI